MAKAKTRTRTRIVTKVRHVGHRVRRRVTKAKPSIAIIAGLGAPVLKVVTGSGFANGPIWSAPNKSNELMYRLSWVYLGRGTGENPDIGSALTSVGTKSAVAGFAVHWIANVTGANRYLARMKLPFRI